jgi:hypothetical protein
MPNNRTLTEKQKLFADEYVSNGGNAVNAYRAAGYASSSGDRNNAWKLLQLYHVQNYMNTALIPIKKQAERKILITLDTMTDKVANLAERCCEAGDRANELSCYQLLMRSRGLLTDNVVLGDVERLDQIDRKILKDAKIFSTIAIPKLLANNTERDAVDLPNNNVNNGVSSNQQHNVAKKQHTDAITLLKSNAPAQPIQPDIPDTTPEQP